MSEFNIELYSQKLSGPTEVTIIVPNVPTDANPAEFYAGEQKYKVLWLFHGGMNGGRDWLRNSNIARYCVERSVIAVIPNAPNSDFANHPHFADGYHFSDFFFEELMPMVQNWFPASKDPKDHFLSGYSMGCQTVYVYGMLHPELFGGLIPLSSPPLDYSFLEPYRELNSIEFRRAALGDPVTFHAAYGPPAGLHTKELNQIAKFPTVGDFLDSMEHSRARFMEAAKAGRIPPIYLPGGSGDRALAAFKEYADAQGVSCITYDITDTFAHNFVFWDAAIQRGMDHFGMK